MSTNKLDSIVKIVKEQKEVNEPTVFEAMSIDELQDAVNEMATQLRDAKVALRNKKLSGLKIAIEVKKEADADVAEELKRLGYHYSYRTLGDPARTFYERYI